MKKEDLNIDKAITKHATASLFMIYEGKMCLAYPMVRNAYMIEEDTNDFVVTVSKTKKVIYEKIKIEELEMNHEIIETDFIKADLDINSIIIDDPKSVSIFADKTSEEIIEILGKSYNVLLDNLVSSNYFTLESVVMAIASIIKHAEGREDKLDDEELIIYETYIDKIKQIESSILESYIKENIINFDLIKEFYTYLLITEPYNIKLFESSLNKIKEFITETTN